MSAFRSPICCLQNNIAGVPFSIAPERQADLIALRDQHGFEIEIVDRRGFDLGIDVTTGTISLSIAELEYIWACTHNYWLVTQAYASAQRSGQNSFDATGEARLRAAANLVTWSKQNISDTGMAPWPSGLPAPDQLPSNDNHILVTNELFLSALGWIIHHEIAHKVLGHPPLFVAYSQQQEKDADLYATHWVLKSLARNDPKLSKRALGMAIALLCLQSLDTSFRCGENDTHPPVHTRLIYCLQCYEVGEQQAIEAFVFVILQFLFHGQAVVPDLCGSSFGEMLGDFLFSISRSNRL